MGFKEWLGFGKKEYSDRIVSEILRLTSERGRCIRKIEQIKESGHDKEIKSICQMLGLDYKEVIKKNRENKTPKIPKLDDKTKREFAMVEFECEMDVNIKTLEYEYKKERNKTLMTILNQELELLESPKYYTFNRAKKYLPTFLQER